MNEYKQAAILLWFKIKSQNSVAIDPTTWDRHVYCRLIMFNIRYSVSCMRLLFRCETLNQLRKECDIMINLTSVKILTKRLCDVHSSQALSMTMLFMQKIVYVVKLVNNRLSIAVCSWFNYAFVCLNCLCLSIANVHSIPYWARFRIKTEI